MSTFKRQTSYGVRRDEPATLSPYDRARREWDNRIGTARVQALHWRVVAILSLVGVIALAAGLVHVSANKEVKTYVIELDGLKQPARITLLDQKYEPRSAQAGYFVGQVVTLVRTRPLDPVVVRENWKKAYGFLAAEAISTMNAYATADPPIGTVEGRPLARTVSISNVLQKSRRTYQVRWLETSYVGGVPQRPQSYTGLFEIEVMPPRDEAEVFRNPLGIYVVAFSWSKEFTDPVIADAGPIAPLPGIEHTEIDDESND
ncbi:MAG: conjugal transfer protein TrbF [Phycisphaerae bacterium]|nr:conjugal transfer protein TrbF [Phycisphaerae bacterium]